MAASREQVEQVIATLRAATAHNFAVPARVGSVIELNDENGEDVVVAADLHGNRVNFEKLLLKADLRNNPRRHLVMQEVCHGGPTYPGGGCMSHLLLEDIASLKVDFPDRFHFILSNHELAELTDFAIMKSGKMLNLTFREGLQQLYGERAEQVREAYLEFLASCPLAVKLASGVLICHSIPENVDRDGYDIEIFQRRLNRRDFQPRGPVFRLVWGRDFREENAAAFADLADVNLFVHGHEPCAEGFRVPNTKQVILDCCCENACYAILPIHGELTQRDVVERIIALYPCRASTSQ
ncbi:MAG: metallophosphoesterase [Pirellulaceae bacterium]